MIVIGLLILQYLFQFNAHVTNNKSRRWMVARTNAPPISVCDSVALLLYSGAISIISYTALYWQKLLEKTRQRREELQQKLHSTPTGPVRKRKPLESSDNSRNVSQTSLKDSSMNGTLSNLYSSAIPMHDVWISWTAM